MTKYRARHTEYAPEGSEFGRDAFRDTHGKTVPLTDDAQVVIGSAKIIGSWISADRRTAELLLEVEVEGTEAQIGDQIVD